MPIVAWILLGVIAGVVANQLSGKRGIGLVSDVFLGIVGAAVAGFTFRMLADEEQGFGLPAVGLSLLGAAVVLTISRASVGPSRVSAPARMQRNKRVRR